MYPSDIICDISANFVNNNFTTSRTKKQGMPYPSYETGQLLFSLRSKTATRFPDEQNHTTLIGGGAVLPVSRRAGITH